MLDALGQALQLVVSAVRVGVVGEVLVLDALGQALQLVVSAVRVGVVGEVLVLDALGQALQLVVSRCALVTRALSGLTDLPRVATAHALVGEPLFDL